MDSLFGGSSSSSQSSTTPVSMTPPAYAALQSPIANSLLGFFQGGPTYGGLGSVNAPLTTANQPVSTSTFAAPLSTQEQQLLGTIMSPGVQSNPALGAAGGFLTNVLNPNYPATLVNSPSTQAAISSAVAPIVSTFQNVTLPSLRGQFAANGQVLNGPAMVSPNGGVNPGSGQGSSAFDKAASIAQTGLEQSVGQTAAEIANQAFQTGLQQQTQAATQAQTLSQTELNNLISSLQAEALPRLIQQYGMDQGLTEFNNRVNVMLQALGLGASISGPDTAESSQSSSNYNYSPGTFGTGLGQLIATPWSVLKGSSSNPTPFSSLLGVFGVGNNPLLSQGGIFSSLGAASAAAASQGFGAAPVIDSSLPWLASLAP